jgi:steroid 5-alpha reductase family enzyme
MPIGYLEALAGIAVSLSILMTMAWMVQQRTGNSGWVDTIWTFSVGLTGAGSALCPVAGLAPNARQWLVAALVPIWSLRLGVHIIRRTQGITDNPRHAACARGWGRADPVIAISPANEWGWATLLARGFMYWILVHVTGIPPLEQQMLRSRSERYRDYQSRTSPFFPLPPHNGVVT